MTLGWIISIREVSHFGPHDVAINGLVSRSYIRTGSGSPERDVGNLAALVALGHVEHEAQGLTDGDWRRIDQRVN
jgi:hypothetical protein